MKTLCVYYTRTGETDRVIMQIADEIEGGELFYISDGKNRKGGWGYFKTVVEQIRGKYPPLIPHSPELPLEQYERIVLAFPIWCEDVCLLAKAFVSENREHLRGELYFVATHMSALSYEEKIRAFAASAGVEVGGILSVQTHKHDPTAETQEFIRKLNSSGSGSRA